MTTCYYHQYGKDRVLDLILGLSNRQSQRFWAKWDKTGYQTCNDSKPSLNKSDNCFTSGLAASSLQVTREQMREM